MQLPALLCSDLHLTAAPSTEYRWELFPWLAAQIKQHHVRTLMILGDLTDAKDNHSAELTNRIVRNISSLPIDDLIILCGNHDWLKAGHEYFRFLNVLPHVRFITSPWEDEDNIRPGNPKAYFLPYSKNPAADWKGLDFSHYDYLFMHQTIKGARASNGQEMEGEALPDFSGPRTYSGDIHVPQIIGGLTYVGSPYHVHFGDAFEPRCILLDKRGAETDLHFETISRVVVNVSGLRELKRKRFRPGDQVKLRVELDEAEKHQWAAIRREALAILAEAGALVQGVELIVARSTRRVLVGDRQARVSFSPQESIMRFIEREELGPACADAGLDIIEDKT